MKVAYISTVYFSDVDLSYLAEMQHLADVDYYVYVTPLLKNGAAFNISQVRGETGVIPASSYPELQALGRIIDLSRMHILNNPGLGRFDTIRLYWKFVNHLNRRNYDVIHLTEFPRIYEFPMYRLRNKTVLSVHDPFMHSSEKNARQLLMRRVTCCFFRHYILFSEAQRQDFIRTYHLNHDRVYQSRLGAYTYLAMHQEKTVPSEPYALFFGQISTHKGIGYFYEAMQTVQQKYPQLKMVVAGKNRGVDMNALPRVRNVDERVRFIPEGELAPLIAGSFCVVCPYLDATQSGVVMSAFAFRKPVIVTRVGGLPEMVRQGELGIIVPPRDARAISDAVIRLFETPALVRDFERAITAHYFEGEYSWKTIARRLYDDCYKNFM